MITIRSLVDLIEEEASSQSFSLSDWKALGLCQIDDDKMIQQMLEAGYDAMEAGD